ncbi:MAG: TetR/AcrR family transcriptional regulator [Candidatus Hydrogenedentota bacterium]
METLRPKEQEIRRREHRILEVTQDLLAREGYAGVTIGKIAELMECSRGTIYNHFPCKEDALLILATRYYTRQLAFYERAAAFRGRPRERMFAVGIANELFLRLYPGEANIIEVVCAQAIRDKSTSDRQAELRECEVRVASLMEGIVRDALACGDLELPKGATPRSFTFGSWALTMGGYATMLGILSIPVIELGNVFEEVRRNGNILADGYGWRPLTSEWDYDSTLQRVHAEVFPEEVHALRTRADDELGEPSDGFAARYNIETERG